MSTLMKIEKKNRSLVHEKYLRLEIVEKIFEIMEAKGIKQIDLAKKMNISKSQVSRLLTDDRNLTLSSVAKIFFALEEELAILTKSEKKLISNQSKKSKPVRHLNIPYGNMPTASRTKEVFVPTQNYPFKINHF